ncbi:MAG: thiamine phosphate synthase [Propionibacteriaceae bacterium]|nr:thiamine phosphate synthase [Propionibacteriaceae bacterium]
MTGARSFEIDLRCYVITSGSGRLVVDTAAAAAAAGAGVIQVREKSLTTWELLRFTLNVARAVREANPETKVVVDDRTDVAYAARHIDDELVHGVHLGQDDLPVAAARTMLGHSAIIGLTTGTLKLVQEANQVADSVDYLGAGPYRLTPTKDSGRPPLGVEGYRPLVATAKMPIVAIGDIRPSDVRRLAATGVAGVALVRAVMEAPDPAAVVREVLEAYAGAQARRVAG